MADRTPYEQAALDYCAPKGIPLSVFLEVWSEADQLAALEWQALEARKCPNGHDITESTLKDNSYAYRADPVRCHACYAIHAAEAQLHHHSSDQNAGTLWQLTKLEAGNGRVDNPAATGSET
jgi:hypothetical protein